MNTNKAEKDDQLTEQNAPKSLIINIWYYKTDPLISLKVLQENQKHFKV